MTRKLSPLALLQNHDQYINKDRSSHPSDGDLNRHYNCSNVKDRSRHTYGWDISKLIKDESLYDDIKRVCLVKT